MTPPRRPRPSSPLAPWLALALPLLAACSTGSTGDLTAPTAGAAGSSSAGGQAGQSGTSGQSGAAGQAAQAGASGQGGGGGQGGAALCTPDADLDQIPDDVEGKAQGTDTDQDGTPDHLDPDSDGDTLPDLIEGQTASNGCKLPQDSDGDGKPDFRALDSDRNGLPDAQEIYPDGASYDETRPPADTDGDKIPDYADNDNDSDTIDDQDELVNGAPVDTDQDGLPDLDDVDSDNDKIPDGLEGTGDLDGDGLPNFRDPDSDGDGLLDSCEVGPDFAPGKLPLDTDQDGKYDFLDLDSDGDGLLDKDEDTSGDCDIALDETDPRDPDSDADGVSDLIEVLLGSNPRQKVETPASFGKVYFEVPYTKPPTPSTQLMAVNLALQRADIGVLVDTTGTMNEELGQLKGGLTTIFQTLAQEIPDVAIGVGGHDDYPIDPYGSSSAADRPLTIPPSGRMTTDIATASAAVKLLELGGGGDLAESQVVALWRSFTNLPYQWPGHVLEADPTVPSDRYGEMAFRPGAFPILIPITDAPFHNGRRASQPKDLHDLYTFNAATPYNQPTIDTLVEALKARGARVIGVASDDGARKGDPYEDLAYLADATGSLAPTSAFGGVCRTQLAGQPIPAPDGPGGTCRLVFNIKQDGSGLGDRIVDGVKALLKSIVLDVRIVAIPEDPSAENGSVDSVDAFVKSVAVEPSGGEDPSSPGSLCALIPLGKVIDSWTGPKGTLQSGDTVPETINGAVPTTRVCYRVTPLINTTVPATSKAQVFRATLQVRARPNPAIPEIDFGPPRELLFVVPPLAQ